MIVRVQTVAIGHYDMLCPLEIDVEREDLMLVVRNRGTNPVQERTVHLDLKKEVERQDLRCGCRPQEK